MTTPNTTPRGAMATYTCQRCKLDFTARAADRARGWARFCSKSCKAIKQEGQTGQHRWYMSRGAYDEHPTFDNAHQFDNTEL